MSPSDTKPNDGGPTIDSLLKNDNWEARVAEARAKREKVLAAKNRAPKSQIETPPPMIKIRVKDKPAPPPLRAIRPHQSPPAPPRLRLRWVFLGICVAACAAGALMLWMR